MSEALTHMIEALGLEIAAIRKKGGGTQIELRGGERVGQTEGWWLYRFVVAEDINLRDDTPVRVTAGQEDVAGMLVSFRDGVLLVALENDLGPRIASARLVANDSFLVERLKDCLEKVRGGEVQFSRAAADRALGLLPPSTADAEPHPLVNGDGTANADQISAVRRSLGSDTTFVWGPPGTGKTTTLARIVEGHYRAGRSVLLVSNTNIAVDTALERVAERLKGEPDFHQGLVIRQGPVVKEELRQVFGPQVILDEIVARLGKRLQQEKSDLLREGALIETEERSLVAALQDLERLASARETLTAREKAREATKGNIAAREREAEQYHIHAAKLRSVLERAQAMGAVRRFLSGLDPERIARDVAAADRTAQAASEAARALAANLPKLQAEIASLRGEVDRLVAETQRHPPEAEIQARLGPLRTRLGQIRERIEAIECELAELEQQVLARCKILATTVYRTYLGKGGPRQFDAVVIDEASMLMPPLIYYVAGLATQSVTVAGDFRQLPPIVMSDEPLAEEWLKCDVFEKAGIPQRLKRREPTPHLVALGTQYRMCEPICAVVNDLFYDDHPLATYKIALGHCLARFAREGKSSVSMADLAEKFFDLYVQRLENAKPQLATSDRRTVMEMRAPEPGHIVCADTALVGRLKEAGIVHVAVAIDGHSSYGRALLAPARNAEMAAAAVQRLHQELFTEGVARIGRALTDNGTEFVGKPKHAFEALCARLGAEHRRTKVRHAWTNGKAERFVQTLKDALEAMLRAKHYGSIAELQADLDRWLAWYNAERPHQGCHNRGRPPLQVIREFQAQQELKAA